MRKLLSGNQRWGMLECLAFAAECIGDSFFESLVGFVHRDAAVTASTLKLSAVWRLLTALL